MAITKSNKHKLSLDQDKPNEKGGCTSYSLCTNEVLNLGLSNLNHPTRLLLSLALQSVSSVEQMGKRAELDELEMYLYTPNQNITVRVQLSTLSSDRTGRSVANGYVASAY